MPLAEASGATCVQRLDDSRDSAIHTKYRISLRSSSWRGPRYPLPRVVLSRSAAPPSQGVGATPALSLVPVAPKFWSVREAPPPDPDHATARRRAPREAATPGTKQAVSTEEGAEGGGRGVCRVRTVPPALRLFHEPPRREATCGTGTARSTDCAPTGGGLEHQSRPPPSPRPQAERQGGRRQRPNTPNVQNCETSRRRLGPPHCAAPSRIAYARHSATRGPAPKAGSQEHLRF